MKGTLIAYRTTEKNKASQLSRALHGYTDYSNQGAYEYVRRGLLEEIPHVKLMNGVFIVEKETVDTFVALLKKFNAEYHVREVTLTEEDIKELQLD